jgi:predicted dehydrogenase
MDKKFRVAVIGCGKVAKKHLKAVLHNQDMVELVALADTNAETMNSRFFCSNIK